MGCASSALNKAGESSRFRSATSKECFPNTEGSKACFAHPKPRTLGREAYPHGSAQRDSPPLPQELKASVAPATNGMKPLPEKPLVAPEAARGEDAVHQSESTEVTRPLERAEGKQTDVERMAEAQSLKGHGETEPLGPEPKGQALRTAGERGSPGALEGTESPHAAGEREPPAMAGCITPLHTGAELQPQEAMGKEERSQLLKATPEENEAPEPVVRRQLMETADELQHQATPGKSELSQLPETDPRETVTPKVVDLSQLMETPGRSGSLRTTPAGPGNLEQAQPEGEAGSPEHPAGMVDMAANEQMVCTVPTHRQQRHTEGETEEQMETEVEYKKASGGAETNEETGEAVDLSAAT
ncbi:glutamate-rich protein 5 isoform X2 [Oryctolagus cuniculus]|uniref:glutamate-rich protein 5 isoform X2 n=1 Tax=Oryctolagus cuniculus TaxID=9986 RepID=UPI0001C62C93|nr:glutamate-rich protein 5 isoform X3 [Oryctolagus cuniculus]